MSGRFDDVEGMAMGYTITQSFMIDIGHRTWTQNILESRGSEFYDGSTVVDKCANIHGHAIILAATLAGDALDSEQFLMHTDLLSGALEPVLDEMDHALILDRNDPLYGDLASIVERGGLKLYTVSFSPSFEFLARHVHDRLKEALDASEVRSVLRIKEVKLSGEQTIEATYSE
ncbi:6-pyruvoyl tetrahydropterin synthase family protein [Streptomyces sp. NPDC059176]|uniref:6-pyruvoyl trahydropterin synthase family protein n=1 Tax=Streptomyces sp. NPDC059176 TaxID=3346758 RepID=UPI0036BEEC50